MKRKIVVIGSSNTDMVAKSEHLPQPGETVLGNNFIMNAGGKGANQAVAAARLGGEVHFIAKVGNDMFGQRALKRYREEGIDITHLSVDAEQPSGIALIMVDANGENSIMVASGANATLCQRNVDAAQAVIQFDSIMLMQLETPLDTIAHAARLATERGSLVLLNPAPACALPDELLRNVYMLIPNETEAEILSGMKVTDYDSARWAAEAIAEKGVTIVVITMGAKGAFVKEGKVCYTVSSVPVKAVDTTAAGDTFCGAIAVALSEGQNVHDAVHFACRCAAVSVTRMGAQDSVPFRRELE